MSTNTNDNPPSFTAEEKTFSFPPNLEKYQKEIEELANELSFNHLANSFGDMPDNPIECKYIFSRNELGEKAKWYDPNYFGKSPKTVSDAFQHRKDLKTSKSCRNILIVGAGASYDSYGYIPLGSDLRKNLEKSFEYDIMKSEMIEQKYKDDRQNIVRLNKGEYDFENCLSLLSNFIPANLLRSKIQDLTSFKYEPSLFYEIVAHLFKHNFIDVIINFNFDELLDNAIEEEVGKNNYFHILHDGDCPTMSELIEDSRLKVPVYIKPHGTSTHTTTLRFTKQHYLDISPEIKNILKSLIAGERDTDSKDKIKRVNLICVGFDLTSLEFNEILNETPLPEESRIYHIAHGNSKKEIRDKFTLNQLGKCIGKKGENRFFTIDIENFNSTYPDKILSPYAEIFSVLWRAIYSKFQEMYRPRSIGRHEILAYIFYRKKSNNSPQNSYFKLAKNLSERTNNNIRSYFIDRIMVEIALSLNRSGGIVDVIHLLNGRIGDYFGLYRRQAELCRDEKKHTIYELLGEFTRETELNEEKNQTEFIYSRNVFRVVPFERQKMEALIDELQHTNRFNTDNYLFYEVLKSELLEVYEKYPVTASILYRLFISEKLSKKIIDDLILDFNCPVNNGLLWDGNPKPLLKEIIRLFSKSAPKNYFYIRSSRNDQKNFMWESFENRNLLMTSLSYKYHYRNHFLKPGNWDVILCISETGSLIDFLDTLNKNRKDYSEILDQLKSGKKRLVIICSYENVRQLHCNNGIDINIIELIRVHKVHLSGEINHIWKEENIDLLLLPYWQHNHHSIIFLKKVTSLTVGDQDTKYHAFKVKNKLGSEGKYKGRKSFLMNRSYYYYKKGFSNSINPLYFRSAKNYDELKRIRNDQIKLMSLYFTYVCRSIVFLSEVNSGEKWFDELSPCFKEVATLDDYRQYTQWSPEYFNEKLIDFMTFIYHRSYEAHH